MTTTWNAKPFKPKVCWMKPMKLTIGCGSSDQGSKIATYIDATIIKEQIRKKEQ